MKRNILALSLALFTVSTAKLQAYLIYQFDTDFGRPEGGVVLSGDTLYGATWMAGIYSVKTNGDDFTVLHAFSPTREDNDAGYAYGNLVLDGDTLYGTGSAGGVKGEGVIYSMKTNGADFTVIHSFGTATDGFNPYAGLVSVGDTLYGTTSQGGSNGVGTVFMIKENGSNYMILHNFEKISGWKSDGWYADAAFGAGTNVDGFAPVAPLVYDNNRLYGTASSGGNTASGTVFAMDLNGDNFTILHNFDNCPSGVNTNADGNGPVCGLAISGNKLYGTTTVGGVYGYGTIFIVDINGNNFSNLYNFQSTDSNLADEDGISYEGGLLIWGPKAYGLTPYNGQLYSIDTSGANFTILTNIAYMPHGTLIRTDHTLLGTGSSDAQFGSGIVFGYGLPNTIPSVQIANIVYDATNNNVIVNGSGDAGYTYLMEATTNLALSSWQTISTNVAGTNGLWQVTDSITNGVFSGYQTNLIYAATYTNNTPLGPVITYSTNVIGTNVVYNYYARRFYRAATAP